MTVQQIALEIAALSMAASAIESIVKAQTSPIVWMRFSRLTGVAFNAFGFYGVLAALGWVH